MDPRFGDMFKDNDFKIDFVGDKYLHLHPEIKYAMDQLEYQELVKNGGRDGDGGVVVDEGEDEDMIFC